jgi:hypothetical protein
MAEPASRLVHLPAAESALGSAAKGRRPDVDGRIRVESGAVMSHSPQDPYQRFGDASATPVADLAVGVVMIASVMGGVLAALLAVGYLASGSPDRAWPFLGVIVGLVVANVLVRRARASARRRC